MGNHYDYERDRPGFLRDCQRRYGDVFRFGPNAVVLADPELIHQILSDTGTAFTMATRPGQDVTELIEDEHIWMQARRRSAQSLGRRVLSAHGARLRRTFAAGFAAVAGQTIDVPKAAQELCGRAAVDFCLHDAAESVAPAAAMLNRLALADIERPRRASGWLHLPWQRRLRASDRDTLEMLTRTVLARQSHPQPATPRDMLDVLLAPGNRRPMTTREIARLLRLVLSASHGVPGAALSWIVHELSARPPILTDVRAESGALPELVDTANSRLMPFTRAVVLEVLRLRPPTWLLGRTAAQPTMLGRWALRPGERVLFSPYLVHRDPRWWKRPDEFNPHRWLAADPPHTARAYFPFGAGPRVCLGAQLGLLQLMIATAQLAAGYDLEPVDATEMVPHFGALLVPVGLQARLRPSHDPQLQHEI
ncbi:cytochrome P450 [Amycolatopsis decaplanina]|uniref:Cytochrome P450 hydroxylase n=1 Tax=Amycolatopsis decaplanina DSM 44594 TaxID=1284240 RepID=M2X491_9PSEU|nr:cytochrome P450 [Amycolatopsis decaplanina]EME55846.1 cytochrome P450 hydroxylase [Amycolatopsis decaplanina DSM 44594]